MQKHCIGLVPKLWPGFCHRHGSIKSLEPLVQTLFEGLNSKNRSSLARAITLVESTNSEKKNLAQNLLSLVSQDLKRKQEERNGEPTSFRIGR